MQNAHRVIRFRSTIGQTQYINRFAGSSWNMMLTPWIECFMQMKQHRVRIYLLRNTPIYCAQEKYAPLIRCSFEKCGFKKRNKITTKNLTNYQWKYSSSFFRIVVNLGEPYTLQVDYSVIMLSGFGGNLLFVLKVFFTPFAISFASLFLYIFLVHSLLPFHLISNIIAQ